MDNNHTMSVMLEVHPGHLKPQKPGEYLLLCFEWVGGNNDQPEFPEWEIRQWI